jgi:hypothetical protein
MFVAIPINELRPAGVERKGAYTQEEQKFQRGTVEPGKRLPNFPEFS